MANPTLSSATFTATITMNEVAVKAIATALGLTPGQVLPTPTPTPVPTPTPIPVGTTPHLDYIVSQNGVAPQAGDDSWNITRVYGYASNPYPGNKASIACTTTGADGGYQPLFVPNGATKFFDLSAYRFLRFSARCNAPIAGYWVGFSGDKDTADGNQIQVDGEYGPTPQVDVWGDWVIPLSAFTLAQATALFKFSIVAGKAAVGTLTQFDNVGLVK